MKFAHLIPAVVLFLLLAAARSSLTMSAESRPAVVMPISKGRNLELRVAVGPPEARLAVWVHEPDAGEPIKGTVLFLHGFVSNHTQVENAAMALRQVGYRVVLIDLRGFGQSTGDQITFGVDDAHDLTMLTSYLQQHDLCGDTVGVYGTSYGAASSILYAAADVRVTTVVAVAPFADIQDEVPIFGRRLLPGGSYLSVGNLNIIGALVGKAANMDLDDSRPVDAIKRTRAHILLIHGKADTIIPFAASEKLHAAAPQTSELLLIPQRGHIDVSFDIPGELQAPTRKWFDRYLSPPAATIPAH